MKDSLTWRKNWNKVKEMTEKDKIKNIEQIFEAMEYFSNHALKDMMTTLDDQQNIIDEWLDISTGFGKGVKAILQETNRDSEKLMEIWKKFEGMAEEMVDIDEAMGSTLHTEFVECGSEVSKLLRKMLDECFENSRELYSSWTSLRESYISGLKSGFGPNYDEIMDAVADFQQTATHVACRNIGDTHEEMRELSDDLKEFAEKTAEHLKEAVESGNREQQDYIKVRLQRIEEIQKKLSKYMTCVDGSYLSSMEPYFEGHTALPFFPWIPVRRMREYESDIEELKKQIKAMEEKLEDKK